MEDYKVVTFYSTSHALRAEKILKQAAIKFWAIPTPRYLSSNCGIAFKFAATDAERVGENLKQAKVEYEGIYPLEKE